VPERAAIAEIRKFPKQCGAHRPGGPHKEPLVFDCNYRVATKEEILGNTDVTVILVSFGDDLFELFCKNLRVSFGLRFGLG